MGTSNRISPGRYRRLREELSEELPGVLDATPEVAGTLDELAYALWPPVHEGRITTYGAIIARSPILRIGEAKPVLRSTIAGRPGSATMPPDGLPME